MSAKPVKLPRWWDAADAEAVARHDEFEATDFYPANDEGLDLLEWDALPEVKAGNLKLDSFVAEHGTKWNCRRCLFWRSRDGVKGTCHGPELKCGTTGAKMCCEQWMPRKATAATKEAST